MVVCDLGSNTIRFLEYDCVTKKRVKEFEKIVRSAEGVLKTKQISNEAIKRIVEAIDEAKEVLNFTKCKGVATAAFRVAKNGKEVIDKINQRDDINFEIISEQQEAYLGLLAVKEFLKQNRDFEKKFATIDLGGASTEIIFYNNKKVIAKSFKIGIVTMTNRCKGKNLNRCIEKNLRDIFKFIKQQKRVNRFIAIAGTPTTMVAFKKKIDYLNYDYKKINGEKLKKEEINQLLRRLLKLKISERERWVGVGRSDLIIVGVKILEFIFNEFKLNDMKVVDDSIREALAVKNCKKKIN